jgi:hypothetical protein
VTYKTGFGLDDRIDTLYTELGTTGNTALLLIYILYMMIIISQKMIIIIVTAVETSNLTYILYSSPLHTH